MPSEFTHLFAAGALGKTFTTEKMPAPFWVLSAVCTIIPDVDIIGYYFGIKYDKGLGVGFFIPFDNRRYFMPWRPIYAS